MITNADTRIVQLGDEIQDFIRHKMWLQQVKDSLDHSYDKDHNRAKLSNKMRVLTKKINDHRIKIQLLAV